MSERIDTTRALDRVHALLERPDMPAAAMAAFRSAYPDAPPR